MQKGKVDQQKLKNVYHTTIFDEYHCLFSGQKSVVAIDTNTESETDGRYVWYQIENNLNGGSVLEGHPYINPLVTDPDQMKTAAMRQLKKMGVPVTTEQIDKIFAQNGYMEPDKIAHYGDRSSEWLNKALEFASPETFHKHVYSIMKSSINRMGMDKLIELAKNQLEKEQYVECLEKIALKKADRKILRDHLISFCEIEADKLKSVGVKAQARFLLSHNTNINKILDLAGTQKYLFSIKLGGVDSIAEEDYMRIVYRSTMTIARKEIQKDPRIRDWIRKTGYIENDKLSSTIDFDLDKHNGSDLIELILRRTDTFSKEQLAAATCSGDTFYFHCKTGEIHGVGCRNGKLIRSSDDKEFPYVWVNVDEYNLYYQTAISPGDEINVLDLGGITPSGQKEKANQAWRDERKEIRDDDDELIMSLS